MLGRSTMEAIHILQRFIERFRVAEKNLHMVFIDLEKAYDKVPRDVLWWVLKKKRQFLLIYKYNKGYVRGSCNKWKKLWWINR